MVIETNDPLHGAGKEFVLRLNPRRLVQQFDVKAFVAEIAETLGELGGEIDLLLQPADHQRNLLSARRGGGGQA